MRRVLLLLLLFGCKKNAPPAPPDAGPAPVRVEYDCGFVDAQPTAEACAPTPAWVTELHELGRLFIEPEGPPTKAICDRARRALAAIDISQVTPIERVVAQNGALRLVGPRTCADDISVTAASAVRALALDASDLPKKPWTELEPWLGAPSTWVERKTKTPILFHDTMEFYTRTFRPVRSPKAVAIFSELVAIDTAWKVHVTPVIGRIEARKSKSPRAPACVGKLDPTRLRCASARVKPAKLDELPEGQFLRRLEGGADCNRCHGSPETSSNLKDGTKADVDERRRRFLAEAQESLASIKKKLR